MKITDILSIVIFFFISTFIFGQKQLPTKLKFHSLTVEDGLPNNVVNVIVQDSLGYIWIGTNDGLCRYDGTKFKIFRESQKTGRSISNNYIQSLYIDKKGFLWIMTDQGLNKYDMTKDRFYHFFSTDSIKTISHNSVTSMAASTDGTYFIGSYGGGIDVMKKERFVENFSSINPSLSSNLISALQLQNDSILWVGTYQHGINRVDLKKRMVKQYDFGKEGITGTGNIMGLNLDNYGVLWISTNKGITVLDTKRNTHFSINKSNCESFSDNDVLSVFKDKDDVIWIGTRNDGILYAPRDEILSKKNNIVFNSFKPSTDDGSILYRSIGSFLQDREENIWIGTHLVGVNIVDPKGEKIRFYNKFAENENFNQKSVWGISEDDQGNIWFGTDGGGLYKLNYFDNKISNFRYDDNLKSLSDNAVLSTLYDSSGNLWIGTYAGGLNKLEKNTTGFKRYIKGNGPNQLNSNDIRVIFEDRTGRIWVGENGGGMQHYQPESDDFGFVGDLGWMDIRAITEDPDGNLWIGTFGNGLWKYDPKEKKATEIADYNKYNGHIIFSLVCTSNEDLWIGSRYKGMFHYNMKSGKVKQYTEVDGLSNNTIHAIIPESAARLWISTNDGLNFFDVENQKFVIYTSSSGIQPGPFNNNSGLKTGNGFLVFGGINGLNLFDPGDVEKEIVPIDIVFTDFKLFNESVPVSSENFSSPLKEHIGITKEIVLQYFQDVITIDYIALHFPFTKDLRYSYKLENYDQDWNYVGSTTSATYRNLPAGAYTFKVKIADESNRWGTNISEIRIVILPAPWFTWPAYLVYFLIGSLGFYMVARYYGERIRLRNSLYYEQKLRQQETEINQERSRFFTNFSHELRTPLTLIIGPVQDLINGKVGQEIKFKLELVQRNAISLLELINKMLEFRKTETEHNHLELIHDNFSIFMEKICNNFTYYANHKGLKFSLKSNGDHYLWFDSHKMQIVFNNILSNAFKYTNQGGKVNVILQEEGKYLKVLVEDSGIGIKADELPSIFNLYYHKDKIEKIEGTGLGLALCKNLIELQHGMIEVESKEGEGTRFILWLNTGREEFDKMENVEFLSDNQIFIKQPFIDDLVLNQTPSDDHINPESDKVILIVDDNVDVINYLRSVLAYNFKIITAQNGEEGIEKAFNSIPDLIISDIMMPVKSGIDLCNRLKNTSQTSHIPIILLTAKVEDSDKITGLHSGADAYITKPFNSQYLVAIISGIFENRKKLVNFLSGQIYGPAQPKMEEQTIEHEFLERLKRLIIDKRSNGELYMDELAMELGFSRSSLYRKVKALTGLSINQFSRKIRIRHAAHLIQESDLNISEVAFDMGFNDLKYFRTCFKEEMGVLPSEIKQTV